jgi:hypothetical protein
MPTPLRAEAQGGDDQGRSWRGKTEIQWEGGEEEEEEVGEVEVEVKEEKLQLPFGL